MCAWLVIDGYEDEPAAFGVPNYLGFHIRYICGVFESKQIDYTYLTIDNWRIRYKKSENSLNRKEKLKRDFLDLDGIVILAGAVVPGKYIRGTPISKNELDDIISLFPKELPILCGGWAIRNWRYAGWSPISKNLFCAVQDTDATLNHFLNSGSWKNHKRTPEEWSVWSIAGSKSKAVTNHPDLISPHGLPGPLVYEVELYQGCVRFKRGCKFCIEPKKGIPIWRSTDQVISEISSALDNGVRNVRIGGATDIYSYQAEGVEELEYPIPNPEPIAKILHEVRNDERLSVLHVDNGNPSIISENIEPSEEITKTLTETLSDGAILSFGLESADPKVHEMNWLNCNPTQLKSAIQLINKYGREKGERGLPKLLPGLNFIAGLNGESSKTYKMNMDLLREIRDEGLWLRRINIRQVEGLGFQEISSEKFNIFKKKVRQQIDNPLLKEMFPVGTILREVHWESQENRIRVPDQYTNPIYWDEKTRGESGITFGRQIGAYPILIGVPYKIPLETNSDVIVTGHGMRSISGTEIGININEASQKQLEAIPGIGTKGSWKIVSTRAKISNKQKTNFSSVEQAFQLSDLKLPRIAKEILVVD